MLTRNDLDIKGYEHPDSINTNNSEIYKSYNTDEKGELYSKNIKTEKYNTFIPEKYCECYKYDDNGNKIHSKDCKATYSNVEYNLYLKSNEDEIKDNISIYLNSCPKCKESVEYECECVYQDMICKNNHVWYIENGKVICEDPHK